MSDLRIGYTNFLLNSYIVDKEPKTDGSENLFLGSRVETYRAPDGENVIRFDIDVGIGNEFAADYLAFTRMDKSRPRSLIPVTVVGADDQSFIPAENEFFGASVPSALDGPNEQDYVLFDTPGGGRGFEITTDYRFYRVDAALLNNETLDLGNIFFGKSFDFGTNPVSGFRSEFDRAGKGARVTSREVRAEWRGVSQALKNDFERNVYKDRDVAPVVLLDRAGCLLDGEKILNCTMEDVRFDMKDGDLFDITVTFVELT